MDIVTRDVRDLPQAERSVLERLVGRPLQETQRIVVQVINLDTHSAEETPPEDPVAVPRWWNIYEGLSDDEVNGLDQAVRQRADVTRTGTL